MRLDRSRLAYQEHDLVTALLETEELLDEDPDNVAALEVLADTELELGHGREAGLVFAHLLRLDPEQPLYLAGMAIACFLHADFQGAVSYGGEALKLQEDLSEAHAYVGLACERLGLLDASQQHLERARAIDPEGWRQPPELHEIPWAEVLSRALERVPEQLAPFYQQVPIVWQQLPDPAVLRSVDPPISPLVLALYEGTSGGPGDHTGILPRSLRIFQGNARRFAHDLDRLVEDLGQALSAEAADWMGIPLESGHARP